MADSDISSKVKTGLAKAQIAVSDGNDLVEVGIETVIRSD